MFLKKKFLKKIFLKKFFSQKNFFPEKNFLNNIFLKKFTQMNHYLLPHLGGSDTLLTYDSSPLFWRTRAVDTMASKTQ